MNYPYETNSITDEVKEIRESLGGEVYLTDPRLVRITRLRLVTDPGFPMWDLSYCYGVLSDGTNVRVELPWWQFSKRNLKGDLIAMCREAGVYGKKLGLLDDSVISKLW
jgi:hypothetical protein